MPKPSRRRTVKSRKTVKEAIFEGVVRDLASDGAGVLSHPDGRTYFVPGVWPGERVEVKPTGRRGSVGFGRIHRVLEASATRRQPRCPHQGHSEESCGGCPWMGFAYDAQCQAKARRIAGLLAHMSADAAVLQPLIAAKNEWSYRNRAQLKTDGETLGFMASGTNGIIDVEQCAVLSLENQVQLAKLRSRLPANEWRTDRRKGIHWHSLDIDDRMSEVQVDKRLPFRQGNSAQNTVMRNWLAETIATLDAEQQVLELFCGDGNFSEILAGHFKQVVAAEGSEDSLAELAAKKLGPVTGQRVDLYSADAVSGLASANKGAGVLVLDPPRDGLVIRKPLINKLNKLETIIYISCNPATWARDCRDFLDSGFKLKVVTPIDLFPQTPHVEIMSVLSRHR